MPPTNNGYTGTNSLTGSYEWSECGARGCSLPGNNVQHAQPLTTPRVCVYFRCNRCSAAVPPTNNGYTQVQVHSHGHMGGASAVHGGAHHLCTTYSTRNYSQHSVYAFIFVVTVDLQWPRWSPLCSPYWYLHTGAMALQHRCEPTHNGYHGKPQLAIREHRIYIPA